MHTYFVIFILFSGSDNKSLACATCNADFTSSWELIQHCQYVHHISIFIDKQVGEKRREEEDVGKMFRVTFTWPLDM